jgi:hypothetical protein
LQLALNYRQHANAISVLFRVLLDLAVEEAIRRERVEVGKRASMVERISKVVDHFVAQQILTTRYAGDIKRLLQGKELLSVETMHRWVHSSQFAPAPADMSALWDTLAEFLVICLSEVQA